MSHSEPLLVKPKAACSMLGCGNTRLYALLAAGELESFLDGRSRKITVASIRRYVEKKLASTTAHSDPLPVVADGRAGSSTLARQRHPPGDI